MHADWNRVANKIIIFMQQADEVLYLVTLFLFNKTKSLSKLPPKINDVLEATTILDGNWIGPWFKNNKINNKIMVPLSWWNSRA